MTEWNVNAIEDKPGETLGDSPVETPDKDAPTSWDLNVISIDKKKQDRRSLDLNAEIDPTEARKNRNLSEKAGMPEDVVASDPVTTQRILNVDDIDGKTRNSPRVRDIMLDSMLGPPTQDDADPLVAIETLMHRGQEVGAGLVRDVGGRTLTGIGELNAVAGRSITNVLRTAGFEDLANFVSAPILPWWSNPTGILKEPGKQLKAAGDLIDSGEQTVAADISRGLGQLTGQVALHLATGGLASLPTMFAQGADIMAERAETSDASQVNKDLSIIAGGTITALTERYGLDKLLNRIPPSIKNGVVKFIADISVAGGIEAAQEVTEGILHNLTALALTDPNAEIFEGIDREAIAAGGSAAIFRTLVNAVVKGRQIQSDNRAADDAQQYKDRIAGIFDAAGQSKVAAESPQLFQEILTRIAEDSDIKTVRVNAGGLEAFADASGDSEAALRFFIEAGIDEADVERAAVMGSDIEVDIPNFIKALREQEIAEGVLANVRENDGAPTLAESEVLTEAAVAEAKKVADEINAEAGDPTAMDVAEEQGRVVAQDFHEQAKAAGATAAQARTGSLLLESFYVTEAANRLREGSQEPIDIEAMYGRFGLQITREESTGQQALSQESLNQEIDNVISIVGQLEEKDLIAKLDAAMAQINEIVKTGRPEDPFVIRAIEEIKLLNASHKEGVTKEAVLKGLENLKGVLDSGQPFPANDLFQDPLVETDDWRGAMVTAVTETGESVQVNAGEAYDIIAKREESAQKLLDCVNAG